MNSAFAAGEVLVDDALQRSRELVKWSLEKPLGGESDGGH